MIEATFFVIAALAAVYLLGPIFQRAAVPVADPRAALEAAQVAAGRSLRDLDLDWATGKLSDEDYQAQRAVIEGELDGITRRLDALEERAR